MPSAAQPRFADCSSPPALPLAFNDRDICVPGLAWDSSGRCPFGAIPEAVWSGTCCGSGAEGKLCTACRSSKPEHGGHTGHGNNANDTIKCFIFLVFPALTSALVPGVAGVGLLFSRRWISRYAAGTMKTVTITDIVSPPMMARASGAYCSLPASERKRHRNHAKNRGQRSHQDRAQAHAAGSRHRFLDRHAFFSAEIA